MASGASTSSFTTATTITGEFPRKVFLAISTSTTENELSHFARSYGPVKSVHIPKDKETQRSRGFAFVTFRYHEHSRAFIESVEGTALDGLILQPRWANPPPAKKETEKTKRNGSRKRRDKRSRDAKMAV